MKELENLKEMYLDEIKKITKKGELTPTDAEAAKKALEAITMIDDICDMDDGEWSGGSYRGMSYNDRSGHRYMMPEMDMPTRRGRSMTTGRYVSRRNATADMMIGKLEDLLRDAPDMETREAIECALDKLEKY